MRDRKLVMYVILVFAVFLCGVNAASAIPVVWSLEDVTFIGDGNGDDGDDTKVTGTFTYDAATQELLDFDITTEDGLLRGHHYARDPGRAYTYHTWSVTAHDGFSWYDYLEPFGHTLYFFTATGIDLTDLGGIVPLGQVYEGDYPAFSFRMGVRRGYLKGSPVPEPATILLFGAGLLGLAGFGRKKFKK